MCLGLATGYREPTENKERTYADLKQTHFPESEGENKITWYDGLKSLYQRLVSNYNDNVPFEQYEEDRLTVCNAVDEINRQQAEIEKLNVELASMRGACNSYKMHYDNAKAKIERLNNNISAMAITLSNSAKATKTEAIKEFADLIDEDIEVKLSDDIKEKNPHLYLIHQILKDRLKEMVGEDK